ncbi:Yip1 family protein [Shimia sp. SDUM112013]|uniref:Yip1 family protein n=1 Tax=Shimia sp. SDUM112013 TaxID=3136160 RepID=UPI0032EC4531
MMPFLTALLVQTLRAPAEAGRTLCALNLNREMGWSALFLACILNTLAYFASISLFPVPSEAMLPMMATPILTLITLFSAMTVTVFALFWTGRILDGEARFGDILTMIAWMQFLRVLVQVATIVLMFVLPSLAYVLVMGAGLYGIWIMVHFLQVAHGFDGLGKAIFTLVLAVLGMTMGLSLFLSVMGVTAMGIS